MSNKPNKYTPEKTYILSNTIQSLILTTITTLILILILEYMIKNYARRSAYKENAIFLQRFVDGALEDLLNLSDSEDSSSSSNTGMFESHQPFVLELHDLVKDEPTSENPAPQLPAAKVKKHRKKKGQPGAKNVTSDTSSSVSESSVPPTAQEEHGKEEFYDAHESYHGLTENQAAPNPVAAAALMQARSEHVATPKPTAGQTSLPTPASATRREPSSTVTKPTTNPH